MTVDRTTFEADTDSAGPSFWFQSRTNWGFSSIGYFLDNSSIEDPYITRNSSTLTVANPELYMNARLSPISLTYYAFCLVNGNYTVKLHFAEIMFTNDNTYSSRGRCLFYVYIQVPSQNIFKQITDIVKCAIMDKCFAGKVSAEGFQYRG